MRFRSLRLLAFGHFTDVEIDLGEEPALHVLYGPNEAGKSTALRAITGLLYGIPPTTADAYLHRMPELRIGAELSQNGSALSVVRRKGNTNTLLDAEGGEPVPEVALRAMLGGVDEPTYRAMFGLDHISLRQGAEALLSGGGSVGETLFDAGMSGRGIQRVLADLRAEADELYRPRGQRQAVNEALRRFKQARERRVSDSVRPDAWILQVEELDRARAASADAGERRRDLVAEQNKLRRAQRVLPMLTKRRGLLERRAALGEVVRLDPAAVSRRTEAQRVLDERSRDSHRLGEDVAELENRLAALVVPAPLAALDSGLVEELYGRLGQHRKALMDLPKRVAELRMRETEVARLASMVGLDPEPAGFERARIGLSVQARVKTLAKRRWALDTSVDDLRGRLKEREADLADLETRVAQLPVPPDDDMLTVALESSRSVAELPETLARIDAEASAVERQRNADLARLTPWCGDAAALARLAIPSWETIDRFSREMDGLASERADLSRRNDELERQDAENRRKNRAQEELGVPPSEADLSAARARRDHLWEGIKSSNTVVSPSAASELDEALLIADESADRLRREAERVAAVASLRAEAEFLADRAATLSREDGELAARENDLGKRWRSVWSGLGFEARSPAEMRDWSRNASAALEASVRLDALATEQSRLRERIDDIRGQLIRSLQAAGGDELDDRPFDDLVRRAKSVGAERELRRREQRDAQRALETLEREVARERRSLSEKEAQLADWESEWATSVAALGLSGEVSTDEALAVLDGMVGLAAKIDEMESMRARVAAIELDIATFSADVGKAVREAVPELADVDAAEAAEQLFHRHQRAVNDLESRRALEQTIEGKSQQLRRLAVESEEASNELRSLMADAGIGDLAALQRAEEKSSEAARLDQSLAEVERELLEAGEGADIEQLLEQTAGVDVDGARARLQELDDEIEALTDEIDRLGRDIGSKESGLEVLENERGAADAAAAEQEGLADLDARVRRFVRVKLAAEILESEVERYRQQNQGPILTRANTYFPRLTLEAYRELRVGYDAKDEEVLRCVRADGTEVDIEALSDGTRDQLYLSLRLATLEHFAQSHDPLPLVMDDVFIHFDDQRAKAALEVLGSFAEHTQILFFTHHARLAELARDVVPERRRVDHDLSELREGGGR